MATIDTIFKEQFGEFTKKLETHTPNADTSWLPNGWQLYSASELFDISIGKTPPRNELEWFSNQKDNNCVWVSIADMKTISPFIFDSTEYLTQEAVKKHNVKLVPANSVLISFKMTVGRTAITRNELTTNEAIAHFPCNNNNLYYTYCYLKNYNYESLGSTSSITTAINSKIIKEMPFLLPTQENIAVFNQKVEAIFKELELISQEIISLSEIEAIIFPQLLSR